MAQHIIMIHGRSTKPAQAQHSRLWKEALGTGLTRAGGNFAGLYRRRLAQKRLKVDVVYYGDINNRILADQSDNHKSRLTDRDPAFGNAKCLPHTPIDAALSDLAGVERFTKDAYEVASKTTPLPKVKDELAGMFSDLANAFTGGQANKVVIRGAMADLGAYFSNPAERKRVRTRLSTKIGAGLKAQNDILLISHSMGCIVSYDVLWHLSRANAHQALLSGNGKINRWITIGCPLGEQGVKENLADRGRSVDNKRFPKDIIGDWYNLSAQGDVVAHDKDMSDAKHYGPMKDLGYLSDISDEETYNCYVEGGKSNPHKAFGYLANGLLGAQVGAWLK